MLNLHRALLLSLLSLSLLFLVALPAHARVIPPQGGPGGGAFSTDCGSLHPVGIYVRSGAWIQAIGLICSSFGPDNKYKKPPVSMAYYGGGGGAKQEGLCPATSYLSGIMFGFTRDGNNPKYVDFVELKCTNLVNGSENRVCLQTGDGCYIGREGKKSVGGLAGIGHISSAIQNCTAGEAVKGIHGRHGAFVDALGLVCGPKPQPAKAPPPPPPPCPAGQMRIKGTCQVPPVISETHTGTGGGFIQMFPTCSEGKVYDKAANACVAKTAEATTCSVDKPGNVYNSPGGSGQKIGELAVKTQGVTLLKKDGANWFQVKWPAGEGWVYSGPGYENALKC